MSDPANQIADVMFLRYTGGKPFRRSLHEKMRIIGRTAERKKRLSHTQGFKVTIKFLLYKNHLVSYRKKNFTTGTSRNRPVQLSHNLCLMKVN